MSIIRPSLACMLPVVRFVPLELCPFASTFVEKPLQIHTFLYKTNPIFLNLKSKTMIPPKNKPKPVLSVVEGQTRSKPDLSQYKPNSSQLLLFTNNAICYTLEVF